jgi:hypothetical protein
VKVIVRKVIKSVIGSEIMNIHVRFQFDKENSKTAVIEAESERAMIDDILSSPDWYQFVDRKGVNQLVNMKQVTSISVIEHSKKEPAVSVLK